MDKAAKKAAFQRLKELAGEGKLIPEKRKAFTPAQKAEIREKSNGLCAHCGGPPGFGYEYDHITPRNWGGETTVDNGQILCRPCHLEKCQKEAPEHAKIRRLEKAQAEEKPPSRLKGRGFEKPKGGYRWPSRKFDKRA